MTYGQARAVVVATGMETEFGRIARMLQTVDSSRTPLQVNLDRLGALLANVALLEGRWDDARRALAGAVERLPHRGGLREKLGIVELQRGRPREALRWFEAERRALGYRSGLDFRRGQVAQAEGDLRRAQALYRRELERGRGTAEVRDSLEAVTRRLGGGR